MQIMILTTDNRLGVKAGEVYEARRYQYDPHEKYSLIARIPDGYDPGCNQYIDGVATKVMGVWCRVVDGAFEEIPAGELPLQVGGTKKVKVTPAQRLALSNMVKLNRPATSQEIGVQIKSMQTLKSLGLVVNQERFGEAENLGRECQAIHWILAEGFDLDKVETK